MEPGFEPDVDGGGCCSLLEFFFFLSDVPGGGEGEGEGELGSGRVDGLGWVEGVTRALRTLLGQLDEEVAGMVLVVEREARRRDAWKGIEREEREKGDRQLRTRFDEMGTGQKIYLLTLVVIERGGEGGSEGER